MNDGRRNILCNPLDVLIIYTQVFCKFDHKHYKHTSFQREIHVVCLQGDNVQIL